MLAHIVLFNTNGKAILTIVVIIIILHSQYKDSVCQYVHVLFIYIHFYLINTVSSVKFILTIKRYREVLSATFRQSKILLKEEYKLVNLGHI